MGQLQCFVTIHDQDLLLACEAAGQFDAFSKHTYLFVGPRPVDRIPFDVDVIVARRFHPNKEKMPQFYDFTGWWTLMHHELVEADNVVFLQYDMTVTQPAIERRIVNSLSRDPGMVAFTAGYFGPNWMLTVPGFAQTYRAGLATRGVNPDDFPPFNPWPSTQGTAWRTEEFYRYMAWFEPMFDVFAGHVLAGHLAERTVKAWSVLNHEEHYMPGVIHHQALDAHGTSALMAGKHKVYQERAGTFGK